MTDTESTRYWVREYDRKSNAWGEPQIRLGLETLRKSYSPAADLDTFRETVLNVAKEVINLDVREATDDEIREHGGKFEVVEALVSYRTAKERIEKERKAAAKIVVAELNSAVSTQENLARFLEKYDMTSAQVLTMAKLAFDDSGLESSELLRDAWAELTASRTQSLPSSKKKTRQQQLQRWDSTMHAKAATA